MINVTFTALKAEFARNIHFTFRMKRNTRAPYNNKPFKAPRTTQASVAREVSKQLAKKEDYKQFFQKESAAVGIPSTGYIVDLLNSLTRGDNATQNIEGSVINMKSLKIRWQFGAADSEVVRPFRLTPRPEDAVL